MHVATSPKELTLLKAVVDQPAHFERKLEYARHLAALGDARGDLLRAAIDLKTGADTFPNIDGVSQSWHGCLHHQAITGGWPVTFAPPDAVDPLLVHMPTICSKKCSDTAIAISTEPGSQFDDGLCQRLLIAAHLSRWKANTRCTRCEPTRNRRFICCWSNRESNSCQCGERCWKRGGN